MVWKPVEEVYLPVPKVNSLYSKLLEFFRTSKERKIETSGVERWECEIQHNAFIADRMLQMIHETHWIHCRSRKGTDEAINSSICLMG